jgi:hypothetical protein
MSWHLHFFLRKKVSEDPVWQTPLVIFSGLLRIRLCVFVGRRVCATAAAFLLGHSGSVVFLGAFVDSRTRQHCQTPTRR